MKRKNAKNYKHRETFSKKKRYIEGIRKREI